MPTIDTVCIGERIHGTFVPENFCSRERNCLQELSFPGTFVLWNFCSQKEN